MKTIHCSLLPERGKVLVGQQPLVQHVEQEASGPLSVYVNDVLTIVQIPVAIVHVESLLRELRTFPFQLKKRASGFKASTTTFGAIPKDGRHRHCMCSATTHNYPYLTELVGRFASYAQEVSARFFPDETRDIITFSKDFDPAWRLGNSAYTSAIVNNSNSLLYHRDAGNILNCVSSMLTLRKAMQGGWLVFPELNLRIMTGPVTLTMFAGSKLLHGVTPLVKETIESYRYTLVYYSRKGMEKCGTVEEELATIRSTKPRPAKEL